MILQAKIASKLTGIDWMDIHNAMTAIKEHREGNFMGASVLEGMVKDVNAMDVALDILDTIQEHEEYNNSDSTSEDLLTKEEISSIEEYLSEEEFMSLEEI